MQTVLETHVRNAAESDLPRVAELGRRFLLEGPYRDELADNPEKALEMAKQILSNTNGRILVAENEGRVIGAFSFFAYPHLFSGEFTAVELIWYVEPEHRAGGIALRLLAEAEKQAKELGCVRMQLTAPSEEVGKLYRYCGGYKKIEVCYQRKL